MTARAVCVTVDPVLRRTLRRTLQGSGSVVEFLESPADLERAAPAQLVVMDREARRTADVERLGAILGGKAKILVLGESLQEDEVVNLMRQPLVDHVISDAENHDEAELVVTTSKLFKGDIFGVEKYLAWGVHINEREVADYAEKREALYDIADFAKEAGVRRQLIGRIESVVDELLMNALYDAPAARYGVSPRISERARAGMAPLGGEKALLRYACDGRHFALSVKDNYGELRKESILDHVARARALRGLPKMAGPDGNGAGLGLYFILSSVTRFIANIDPGHRTEVICMFDARAAGKDADTCARSLHVFTAPREVGIDG